MGFSASAVSAALAAASNDPDRAAEMLIMGTVPPGDTTDARGGGGGGGGGFGGDGPVTAATHWLVGPVWDNLRSPSAVKARTALTDLNGIMATLHESGQTLDEVIQEVVLAVVEVLERHEAMAGVVEPAIRLLWYLTINSGAKGVIMNAVPTVLRVGARYDSTVSVVRVTLKLFNNLAVDEENRVPLRSVVPCVLAAMRAHGGDEEASYSVMSTLLGLSCAEANAAVVCDCIQDMTSVMEQQMETKDVVRLGMAAFANLSAYSAARERLLSVVPCALFVMGQKADNVDTVDSCMKVLFNLVQAGLHIPELFADGARETISRLLERYPDHSSIASKGWTLLEKIESEA